MRYSVPISFNILPPGTGAKSSDDNVVCYELPVLWDDITFAHYWPGKGNANGTYSYTRWQNQRAVKQMFMRLLLVFFSLILQ